MKICFVADNINPKAGLGRMVSSIANRLQNRGHEIGFVVSSGESNCPLLKVGFRFSLRRPLTILRDLYKIRTFVKDYDVIVCFDVQPAGILAHLATWGRSDVIIVHALGTYSLFTLSNKIKNKLISYVYKKSNSVWIINDFVKKKIEVSNESFSFVDNIDFIPVGVDTKLFTLDTKPTYKYAQNYIISVGAIKERKGQLDSIKAFNAIKDRYPNLKYVIVGSITDSRDYYQMIQSYIREQNLQERIIFLQNLSDSELLDLYKGALFFILTPVSTPQSIEGFGMVYLEAALCGLPAIGTLDTGAETAIVENESGLLVRQGDVARISNAMNKFLVDDVLRKKFATKAHEHALRYDWKHVVDLYESELSKLINTTNPI